LDTGPGSPWPLPLRAGSWGTEDIKTRMAP